MIDDHLNGHKFYLKSSPDGVFPLPFNQSTGGIQSRVLILSRKLERDHYIGHLSCSMLWEKPATPSVYWEGEVGAAVDRLWMRG